MKTSKGLRRFETRLNYFRQDLEFVDLIVLNKEKLKGTTSIIEHGDDGKHPLLQERKNCANSRGLVALHLRKTVYVSFLKDVYEEMSEYFQYLLKQGSITGINSGQLIGEHGFEVKANLLLDVISIDDLRAYISSEVFRKLENEQSTQKLLIKMNKKLGLNIPPSTLEKVLPYIELRHIYVHRDGKPDGSFRKKNPQFTIDSKGRIALNLDLINDAFREIYNLLKEFDKRMINKHFIPTSELK